MSYIVLIARQKQSHPHGDDQSEMTKGEFIMIETSQNQRNMDLCAHAAIEMICHGITV